MNPNIITSSPLMLRILDMIKQISATNSTVLITGESGTGKELIANSIHLSSSRKQDSFVALNCSAIPEGLLESELFGHEKGAFSGAHSKCTGKFEFSNGGTIFLDEIGTLPLNLQAKFLRVLQEKQISPLGSNRTIKLDIRVIAATNIDLEIEVKKCRFREDLFYRLNVIPIKLPALRERREDIPLLAKYFINKFSARMNKKVLGISQMAMDILMNYHWPGNIRELENIIEMMVVLSKDHAVISSGELQEHLSGKMDQDEKFFPYKEALKNFEKEYIMDILKKTNWNKNKAAKKMDLHRNTLLNKMKGLGIFQH